MKTQKLLLAALLLLAGNCFGEAPLDAEKVDAIRERAGTDVAVKGQVYEVGKTKEGTITFINIGAPKKQGFVAVVFGDNYASFPEGFDKYRGRTVVVTGAVELYRGEQPQIVLRSPEQITIVED